MIMVCLVASAEPRPQLQHSGGLEQWLEISPDGKRVLLNEGKRVWVWDADQRLLLRKMQGFERITCAKFSPDGRSLAVGDYPQWLGYFDCKTGIRKRWEFRGCPAGQSGPQTMGGYDVCFSTDGRYLLLIAASHGRQPGDSQVRILETDTGKVLREYPLWGGGGRASLRNFMFSPDSNGFARATQDKLQYYSLPGGQMQGEIQLEGEIDEITSDPRGVVCNYQRDGRSASQLILLPTLQIGEEKTYRTEAFPKHPDGTLSWSRDSHGLVTVFRNQKIFGNQKSLVEGSSTDFVRCWVRGGGFLFSTATSLDVYDIQGKKLATLEPSLRLNPAATVGLSIPGYGGQTKVYDLLKGRLLETLSFASDGAFSADGRTLALNLKEGVLLVDIPASLQQGHLVDCQHRLKTALGQFDHNKATPKIADLSLGAAFSSKFDW